MAKSDVVARTPDGFPLSQADGFWNRLDLLPRTLYWSTHAACLLALWTGVSRGDLVLLGVTLFVRMFAITGGYHRYFSHRTFRTSRAFQFVLAFLGASATQKGPLWWAGHHRVHHANSDQPGDVHSPRRGFWYAHQAWIFDPVTNATRLDQIRDFGRYPELVWLNRYHVVAPLSLIALCVAIGGASGFVWGFAISTTLLWHFTYTINSLAHLWGSRRYDTPDTSRNNALLALITLGEGWHNNHHYYMASARQGFRWWEIDVTYYLLRGLQAIGVVWDIREPPAHVVDPEQKVRRAA
jgi:stearoyl-CoA desaturase (delta-9 desaturase)